MFFVLFNMQVGELCSTRGIEIDTRFLTDHFHSRTVERAEEGFKLKKIQSAWNLQVC